MDMKPSKERVALWKGLFVEYLTGLACYIRHVVLLEDMVDTLKV